MNLNEKFLCSDGIIREKKPTFLKYLRYNKKFQMWSNDEYEKYQEVTDICIFIANAFFNKIGEQDPYVIEFQSKNLHIFDCGLTSESNLTKEKFSETLDKLHNEYGVPRETINGSLYISDARFLIFQIKNCYFEVLSLVSEFYYTLNTESFCDNADEVKTSITRNTGYQSNKLHSISNMFFIRIFSLFDYIHKVAFEVTNPVKNFKSYKKMNSSGVTNSRKIYLKAGIEGTLFEESKTKIYLRTIRDQIIHDGFLDEYCQVYKKWSHGELMEKFILLPDTEKGQFLKCKSRHLFYGRDNKTNIIILDIMKEITERLIKSLKAILISLDPIFDALLDKKNIQFKCVVEDEKFYYEIEQKLFIPKKLRPTKFLM